jgi:hypothetical protein
MSGGNGLWQKVSIKKSLSKIPNLGLDIRQTFLSVITWPAVTVGGSVICPHTPQNKNVQIWTSVIFTLPLPLTCSHILFPMFSGVTTVQTFKIKKFLYLAVFPRMTPFTDPPLYMKSCFHWICLLLAMEYFSVGKGQDRCQLKHRHAPLTATWWSYL